jgi:hypothetical protein
MGGRAGSYQQRFPAGCLYRQGAAGHAIAYANCITNTNAYVYTYAYAM